MIQNFLDNPQVDIKDEPITLEQITIDTETNKIQEPG